MTRQLSGSVHFPNKRGVVSGLTSFSSGFDIGATPISPTSGLQTADSQPQNAAAAINARQQIANAIHIVVRFNIRFGVHYGLNSDIAAYPKRANKRHRTTTYVRSEPPSAGSTSGLQCCDLNFAHIVVMNSARQTAVPFYPYG